MRLQHDLGQALYLDLLQATMTNSDLFGFRNKIQSYGLHIFPLQLVLPTPSAWATEGITTVFRKSTAAASTSSMRFMVVFSLLRKLERDTFMSAPRPAKAF